MGRCPASGCAARTAATGERRRGRRGHSPGWPALAAAGQGGGAVRWRPRCRRRAGLEKAVRREAVPVNPLPAVIDKSSGRACRSRGVADLTIMLAVSAIAALIIYWVAGPVES